MIRLPKSFLLCGLIVNVIACAVSQADVRAAAVETFARRLETPWAIDFASSSKWKNWSATSPPVRPPARYRRGTGQSALFAHQQS